MGVGWRRLSIESAGVGEKRLRLTGLLQNSSVPNRDVSGLVRNTVCPRVPVPSMKHMLH